ncbi:MAG: [LysW]-aminoadipate/[LysW]-glutamate kinase [Nitrososphaerales archaeon]
MSVRGPTIVCKIGGSVIEGVDASIVDDIRNLQIGGSRMILVHGGGDQVTEMAERLGKKQQFITSPEGIKSRYTDKETVEIFTMVMSGLLSKQITQTLERNGISAVSLTGIDGGLLRADRKKRLLIVDERGRKVAIDGGYTGKINQVNTGLLDSLLDSSIVPVVSPIAAGEEWELLNVDGDRACSHIAGAVRAEHAIFLTDTEGLILNGSVVKSLNIAQARDALPSIGPGMDKKVIAAVEAVEMGAKKSTIATGLRKNPLANAIVGNGTVITAN